MRFRHQHWLVAACTLGSVTALTGAGLLATAPAASARALPTPSRARHRVGAATPLPFHATRLGAMHSSRQLRVTVTLEPRDPSGLSALAAAVSDPTSPAYRHYLSRQQWVARFAPSLASVDAVRARLDADGLHATIPYEDRLSLSVTGSVRDLERAFDTTLSTFRLADGRVAYANTTPVSVPAAISGEVQGVIGLQDVNLPQPQGMSRVAARSGAFAHRSSTTQGRGVNRSQPAGLRAGDRVVSSPSPSCSGATSSGEPAYTINEIADAYGFSSLYDTGDLGAGQTVAIYELEPNLASDIAAYQACFGTDTTVNYVPVDGGAGTGAGEGEAALDIENIIGLAPKATLDVYQGPNSGSGPYETYQDIISVDSAEVISTSWGQCEPAMGASYLASENTLFEEAAIQGQSIFAAAGDTGSEACYRTFGATSLAVLDPASQPYVTGVGGTTLKSVATPPSQVVWNEAAVSGGSGGGGISAQWPMPSYQSGAPASLNVIDADSSGSPCSAASGDCREVPDVSADADPYTGYMVYYDGGWTDIGGTSAAAPLWAGYATLVNASAACSGENLGFANPALYAAAAKDYSGDFDDITSGNNDYTGTNGGLYPAESGYSMAAGLGTPVAGALDTTLCAHTVSVTNPGSQAELQGKAVSLQLSGVDSDSAAALTWSASRLPAGVAISSAGLISGTPTVAGSFDVTAKASDSTGAAGSTSFEMVVDPDTVTVISPGNQSIAGAAASLQLSGSDAAGLSLTWAATGLPAGLSISSTGLISGTLSTAGTYTVAATAKDSLGVTGNKSFTWTVGLACTPTQLLGNPTFSTGKATPWSATAGVIQKSSSKERSYTGNYLAWLGRNGQKATSLSQKVTLPGQCSSDVLKAEIHVDTTLSSSKAVETLKVQVVSGSAVKTLATYSDRTAGRGYVLRSFNLGAYRGKTVTVRFVASETRAGVTNFCVGLVNLKD